MRSLRIDPAAVRARAWVDNGPGWVAALFRSADDVLALDPDFAAMGDQPVGVVGPLPPGGEADVEVRAFVPGIGVPEDPVTGSLAGGLGIWWLIDFIMLLCQAFKDSDGYTLRWDTVH